MAPFWVNQPAFFLLLYHIEEVSNFRTDKIKKGEVVPWSQSAKQRKDKIKENGKSDKETLCEIGSKSSVPFSYWIVTSVILTSSVIIRVFMALGSAKISQGLLRSESSKFWSSTFSRRNLPNYIYEYQGFKITRGCRLHCFFFFQVSVPYWNIRPPFHWMYLIRRLWILIEYPSENDFHKKSRGTRHRIVSDSVIQSHQDVSVLSSGPSHWGIFDPQACHVRITKQQHHILSQLHQREKEVAGGQRAKKQTKLSSHFSLLFSQSKNIS